VQKNAKLPKFIVYLLSCTRVYRSRKFPTEQSEDLKTQ